MKEAKVRGAHPALTDVQTGLPNRLHFDTVFDVIFAAGNRGIPLTLILVEASPYFPWASSGPSEEVDRVLRELGASFGGTIRQTDLVARLDEARFAFVLLDCNLAGGHLVADRVDALLDPFRKASGLSCSIGVAAHSRDMARPHDLLGAAEQALRAAQALGPNQIEYFR